MKSAFINILMVGAGSCVGGMARYLLSRTVQSVCNASFPWGTFAVNIAGCFAIGLIYGFIDRGFQMSDSLKLFLTAGFCGGFTTFSTFMNENYLLFNGSQHLSLALYMLASALTGFAAVSMSYTLTRI